MKKIRVGFIGVGFISQTCHLPCFYHNKDTEIVAISDKNQVLLNEVSKKYKIKNLYKDYNLMIKNEKLDAIVVIVERHFTAEILKKIIKFKIPIFTEKPPALTYKDAKILKKLALQYKTPVNVGYMKIYDKGIIYLKRLLSSNKIGNLENVIYFSHGGDSYCSPFMYHRIFKKKANLKNYSLNKKIKNKKEYLNFINAQSHSISLIKHLFGKLNIKFQNVKTNGSVSVMFASNNIDIFLDCKFSSSKKWEEKIFIFHSKGKIEVDLPAPQLANVPAKIRIYDYEQGSYSEPNIPWSWAFKEQADEFIDFINRRKKAKYLPNDIVNCSEDIDLMENIFK